VNCGSRRPGFPLEDSSTPLLPVLVITAAHSRFTAGRMIPTRTTEDLLLGSWELIRKLGRVPRRLIWDNQTGIGRGGKLADGVAAFTGTLATRIVQLRPRDPESKGIVARPNGYFETPFLPGRVFASPADFNGQFAEWLDRASSRVMRTLRARPSDLIEADRAAMLPLPAIPPPLGWGHRVRLGRDYYVRRDASDYSVDPAAIGRLVDVTAGLNRVTVRTGGHLVAGHARVWARGITVTDPGHLTAARQLRQEFRQPRPPAPAGDLLRDLAGYDRAFGLISSGGAARMTTPASHDTAKQLRYLAAALKAPRITEAAGRLAEQARDAGWTHEDYLAAVLEREVSARNASGAQLRIRAAGFPARKTLDDFDFDAQPAIRQQIAALASGAFLTQARNIVLPGPPGTGKTHIATGLAVRACQAGHRVLFATATDWVTRLTGAHRHGLLPKELARLRPARPGPAAGPGRDFRRAGARRR
jgi:hypothetical protein